MREMTRETFSIEKTVGGLLCVRQVTDEQDKNHTSKDNAEAAATDAFNNSGKAR
jgi:hypothetical protein